MALKAARALLDNPFASSGSNQPLGHGSPSEEHIQTYELYAQEFREFLIKRHVSGHLHANDLCKIAYYHERSGGIGLSDLALSPSQADKNGHAHVQDVLANEYNMPNLYSAEMPTYNKHDARRSTSNIPVRLATDTLSAAYADAGDTHDDGLVEPHLNNLFLNHPVVRRSREAGVPLKKIIPVSLYWDGVMYTRRDSFYGFYFTDLRSGLKYMSAMFRAGLRLAFRPA